MSDNEVEVLENGGGGEPEIEEELERTPSDTIADQRLEVTLATQQVFNSLRRELNKMEEHREKIKQTQTITRRLLLDTNVSCQILW
jgi:hypothetical protein